MGVERNKFGWKAAARRLRRRWCRRLLLQREELHQMRPPPGRTRRECGSKQDEAHSTTRTHARSRRGRVQARKFWIVRRLIHTTQRFNSTGPSSKEAKPTTLSTRPKTFANGHSGPNTISQARQGEVGTRSAPGLRWGGEGRVSILQRGRPPKPRSLSGPLSRRPTSMSAVPSSLETSQTLCNSRGG